MGVVDSQPVATRNDLELVRRVRAFLRAHGVDALVFGGWAEELLRLAPPREHRDVDLLCLADDFSAVDAMIEAAALEEIVGKRFPHKRAFGFDGVIVELFLVRRDERGWYTDFWGRLRHDWPRDLPAVAAGLPVASAAAVGSYRAAHERLRVRDGAAGPVLDS